ncbi:hypothetical protein OnM2_068052 [Erysiphe neolycopersici]|uniref:DUF7598 domain-containing protein n=1 Tax=Erysiphe neolycopersici TaxID=212602 RepID=A0A420HLI6_9PEZI|nr:hypothetical protein OnM2_068052 [Erysiphe neolycopersici]
MGSLGYLTLNVLRIVSIIVLLLSAITSWTILVMSFKTDHFYFFDGVSHVVISIIGIFLICSESGLFDRYFAKHWPILGPESGLVFLGVSMILLGSSVLGNLKMQFVRDQDEDEDENGLGISLRHLVLGSGILISIFGLFNIIATYVFCDRAQGINSRQMRMYNNAKKAGKMDSFKAFSISNSATDDPTIESTHHQLSLVERKKSRFRLPLAISSKSQHPQAQSQSKLSMKISMPIQQNYDLEKGEKVDHKVSPLFPELERPPTALHPAYKQTNASYPASSRYSVITNR